MPVEIRELVLRASIPEPKEESSAGGGEGVVQRASNEAPSKPKLQRMTPESTEKIIDLCVARVMELLKERSFR